MNLGILCTMINGFGRRGFYNMQEVGLGRALVRKGHNVYIYKALKKEKGMQPDKEEIEPGLIIYYLPIRGLGAHGYLKADILDKELDGLLCFSDNQVFLPHIYRYCLKNKICFVPYVGTTHSLHSGLHAKIMDSWFAMGTLRIFRKSAVIAKTENAKRKLNELGVENVAVAPVGLDVSVLKKDFKNYDRSALRRKYGFTSDEVVICSICRLEPEKRPLDLIEIFQHIRDKKSFRLLLVGEGMMQKEVESKIAEYGLEDRILMIKRVPYQEIWEIFFLSDYFVNLNKGEIFGMAIMEAIYYNTSVAAVKAPGPSLTLKGMKGHCLCADDSEVEAWLTASYPSQQTLEESAEKILRDFSWDKCASAFCSIAASERGMERGHKKES